MRIGYRIVLPVAGLCISMGAASADGFRTPSDNIYCLAGNWDGTAELRCDIRSNAAALPPPPADCELDWGNAFVVSGAAAPASRACAGDTVMDPAYPILHYGSKWEQHGFICSVETDSVTCRNTHGNGFSLSRKSQTLF